MNAEFKKNDSTLTIRSSAIIYDKEKKKVLVFKIEDGRDYYLLPGGRVELFEDSKAAINREIKEELNYDLEFEFCSIQENFLELKDKVSQYCFCYKAIYNGDIEKEKFKCLDNSNQYFYWINIDELDNYKIYPKSSYDLIKGIENVHIIERLNLENRK